MSSQLFSFFKKNGEKSQDFHLQKMLILNPCPSWELQEMFNSRRKKGRNEIAGKEDQYRAKKWYGPQAQKTSKQD